LLCRRSGLATSVGLNARVTDRKSVQSYVKRGAQSLAGGAAKRRQFGVRAAAATRQFGVRVAAAVATRLAQPLNILECGGRNRQVHRSPCLSSSISYQTWGF
jgi:hypothetical protein